jgi:hypothetical protein
MGDPERVEAVLRGQRQEVSRAKAMDAAHPATRLERVDNHHLATTLEVTYRSEARDPGIEQLHVVR